MISRVCYLCGRAGADSKDHLPPKALLPQSQFGTYQRITVPAHRLCNSAASGDEEYVRDLLIMQAEALRMPGHENLTPRVWRSWTHPRGFSRYKKIIETAVPVELRTEGGVFAGKAIGVRGDAERIQRVGRKIVRGFVYHDAKAVLPVDAEISIPILNQREMLALRARDAADPFWIGLSSDHCLHDVCAETVAIRRFYHGHYAYGEAFIAGSFVLMLWNVVLLAQVVFPLASIEKQDFRFSVHTEELRATTGERDA